MNDGSDPPKWRQVLGIGAAVGLVAVAAGLLIKWWQDRQAARLADKDEASQPKRYIPAHIQGLSEEEAAARQADSQNNSIEFKPHRTPREIWKDSLLTIFNLNVLGLAFVQILLDRPLDALISLGILVLNTTVNVVQQALSKKRLDEIDSARRPQVTVIRDARAKSIHPSEIVLGDVLVIGPGDQFMVDGELLEEGVQVDETMLTGVEGYLDKEPGEWIYAGSYCISGRALYRAERVGADRLITVVTSQAKASEPVPTPLQRIIQSILLVLLGVVVVLSVRFLGHISGVDTLQLQQVYLDAASLIFSLAPSGLLFMIVVTYMVAAADITKVGALVHQASSIESLANIDTLCFSDAGALTGWQVHMELLDPPPGEEALPESRVRQLLGDYARSMAVDSPLKRLLVEKFDGEQREVVDQVDHHSLYGWTGLAFDEADVRGTYVLGEPEVIEANLVPVEEPDSAPEEDPVPQGALGNLRKGLSGVLGRLRPTKDEPEDAREKLEAVSDLGEAQEDVQSGNPQLETPTAEAETTNGEGEPNGGDKAGGNAFRRMFKRLGQALPGSDSDSEAAEDEESLLDENVLVLAYRPEVLPLAEEDGVPQLPDELIPLAQVTYVEQVRSDAKETMQAFIQNGVVIKVLSAEDPRKVSALLGQAGITSRDGSPLSTVSGAQLADMDPVSFRKAVWYDVVFGNLSPEQKKKLIHTLRLEGVLVGMVGANTHDIPALRQADLGIAMQSSSQATLSEADIVLLDDSLKAMLNVLEKGQRVLSGLMDVLKINLSQILYLLFLILTFSFARLSLPYQGKQGSLIIVLTVALPSVALTLWASAGAKKQTRLGWELAHFILPASTATGLAALVVYLIFRSYSADVAYAQLGVTYTLIACGMLLVLFVQPPSKFWVGGDELSGDMRFTWLVVILLGLFLAIAGLDIMEYFFATDWLRHATDYLIVGSVVLIWTLLLLLWWRTFPIDKVD